MSHAVQINYRQVAVQCHSICEVAESQISELDRMLSEIESSSTRLLNEQTMALRAQIEKEKESLLREIKAVRDKADNDAKKGTAAAEQGPSTVSIAQELQRRVNQLASGRLVEMNALLDKLLLESINSIGQDMLDRGNGIVRMTSAVESLLNSIEDDILKQFTYLAYLRDQSLSGDALLAAGKEMMDETVESRYEKETERIKAELAAAKVSAETVEQIVGAGKPLSEIREAATTEIVGEKVRQKSLKIIMNAIKERGFIVDKKNIRINRETNEVTLIALKASGEKATFRVFLDGKFIYDFRGYEGQACQKDIESFMQALEEVYGMHIVSQQEIWSNPDKISTMKYQAMNTNKNKR